MVVAESPAKVLLADRSFRSFWFSQVAYAAVNGSLRFTFTWLVVTLTDWSSAEGLVVVALGLPAMVLAVPAGAYSDRVDRMGLFSSWTLATAAILGVFTVLIHVGAVVPQTAGIAALLIGTTITVNLPNLQAMVPLLVPKERLMHAAALQNGGSQAANFVGLAMGGVAITLFGDAGGFALLTILMVVSLGLMRRVDLPVDEPHDGQREPMLAAIVAGARFGLGHDPLRTLLLLALVLGSSFSVMQVLMPRVVADDFGQSAAWAGIVLGSFGIGMLISSVGVARRTSMRHGVNVARYIGIGLGMGQFLLSFAPNVVVAIGVMLAWGLNAGVAIASHRTLMQTHTPPEMMGRVMGLMMFGFAGGLPIGASAAALLAPSLGQQATMRTVGLVTMAITIPLTWRRAILDLR